MTIAEIQALLGRAGQLFQAGQSADALGLYQQVLDIDPAHLGALNMAGAAAWQAGQGGAAKAFLRRAIAAHPDQPQAHGNLGVMLEADGLFAQAVEAYSEALRLDANQPAIELNRGNALAALSHVDDALAAYDRVLSLSPDNPDALNNKGLLLKDKGDMNGAHAVLRTCVEKHPSFAQGWINLGLVLRLSHQPDEAFRAYQQALTLSPGNMKALANLAVLHRWQGNLDEAEKLCRLVLNAAPDSVEVLNNLGDILQALGRHDEAEATFRQALELDPVHAEGHHNLAVLLLLKGNFEEGWKHYEWRWLAKEFPSERRNFTQPLWTGEALDGQTILLYVEQGLGDAMQFARYAPLVARRGGRVVVEAPKTLKRLFEPLDGVTDVIARGDALPAFDVQCPFLSLPGILSPTADSIPNDVPYLSVDDGSIEKWRDALAALPGLKVGLSWQGSVHHTNDRERSLTLKTLEPLAAVAGCSFVSLQLGDAAEQINDVGFEMFVPDCATNDYADTAALMMTLDLVISIDTSVVHAAGALGRPVWVLLSHTADWRWQVERTDTPWYPTATLYRQSTRRDWDSVIDQVRIDLASLATAVS